MLLKPRNRRLLKTMANKRLKTTRWLKEKVKVKERGKEQGKNKSHD